MKVDSTGHMEGVYAAFLFQVSGHSSCVLNGLAAFHFIAGVDTTEDGQVAASLPTDVFDDEAGQTHPVFKAAAELIGAVVGTLGDESAHQVTVGAVDFNHVDASLLGTASGVAIALDQAVHFLGRHGHRDLTTDRSGHGAGCLQRVAGEGGVALGACVLELDGDFGAVGVAGVCHPTEAVNGVVREQAGLAGAALGFLVDDGGFDGDQAESALGACLVVGQRTVAEGAIGVGEVVAHGRHDETVGDGHSADLHRGKHSRKLHILTPPLWYLR